MTSDTGAGPQPQHRTMPVGRTWREFFLSKDMDFAYAVLALAIGFAFGIQLARGLIGGGLTPYDAVFNIYGISVNMLYAVLFVKRRTPVRFPGASAHVVPILSMASPNLLIVLGGYFPAMWSSPPLAIVLFLVGLIVAIGSFWTLGKSFGVLPAVREVVVTGPYKAIRHPAYLGETIYLCGIMLHHLNYVMFVVFIISVGLAVARIVIEEKVLSDDPRYVEYKKRTRYRLLPGVW